jgi:hypothetical protein
MRRGSDESYCRRRAAEEQAAARKATSASARERHDEMAEMYHFRAEMLTPHLASCRNALPLSRGEDVDLLAD